MSYVLGGSSGTEDVVCEESEPFIVIIEDPCDTANIFSAGLSEVMVRPQMQSAILDLNEVIVFENGFGSWLWTVDVDNNNSDLGFYGLNLCSKIEYIVVEPNSLISLILHKIVFFNTSQLLSIVLRLTN